MHPAAAVGFDREAATYAQVRPSYPDGVRALLVDAFGAGPGTRACDLAAGTGIFTRVLVGTGADVVAIEPVAGMRAELARALPELPVLEGRAEALPVGDATLDLVTVAQAFHWFDAEASLREMHRVLRPGGGLLLVWNARDESVDWVRAFGDLIESLAGGRPYTPHETTRWEDVVLRAGGFTHVATRSFLNPQTMTPEGLVARALSTSYVAALAPEPQQRLLEAVRELCRAHPQLAARATFELPHLCTAFAFRRA